jgi:hypothetical protein
MVSIPPAQNNTDSNNIHAGQAWTVATAAIDDEADEMCSDYAKVLSDHFLMRQHAREYVEWFQGALMAACGLNEPRAESSHLGKSGSTYWTLREHEQARRFFEEALMINRRLGDRQG